MRWRVLSLLILAHASCATSPATPPAAGLGAAPDPSATPLNEGVGPAGPVSHRLHDAHAHPHGRDGRDPNHGNHPMPHRFDDAARWAAVFDAPERDAWQRPTVVVAALVGAREDLVVADIGAGTGYFAVHFARALPAGRVIAADIEPTLLAWVAERAQTAGLMNLTTHLTPPDGLAWGADMPRIDLAFSCNTYHHIADRPRYFAGVRAALAPRGRLAIVDFTPDSPRGPARHHRVPPEVVIAELAEAGFRMVARLDLLPDQFLLVFE